MALHTSGWEAWPYIPQGGVYLAMYLSGCGVEPYIPQGVGYSPTYLRVWYSPGYALPVLNVHHSAIRSLLNVHHSAIRSLF